VWRKSTRPALSDARREPLVSQCRRGGPGLHPAHYDGFLERQPDPRNVEELLGRKVELQARATEETAEASKETSGLFSFVGCPNAARLQKANVSVTGHLGWLGWTEA
jgi:hypothetical protein